MGNGWQLDKQAAPFGKLQRKLGGQKIVFRCMLQMTLCCRELLENSIRQRHQHDIFGNGVALLQQRHQQRERGRVANCVGPQSKPEERLYVDTSGARGSWPGAFGSLQFHSKMVRAVCLTSITQTTPHWILKPTEQAEPCVGQEPKDSSRGWKWKSLVEHHWQKLCS